MRIGIISDIHSNLESFERALFYFEKNKIDKLIICGDVIGYGPDPERCINLAENFAEVILRGNHEEGIINKEFIRFKEYARISLEWTIKEINEKIEKIKGWKEIEKMEDIIFVHASLTDIFYKYILKLKDAEEEFEKLEGKICFVGHTHIPGGFIKKIENGKIEKIISDFSGKMEIEIKEDFKYIINVGSVGFPRDGFPFVCVSIYDTDRRFFKLDRIEYDYKKTIQKIIEKGLPSKIGSLLKGF
ncbi:MAG: metallophosphatase family protein [Candidatus Omnitrophica bacterium]|nr:metallophosphatase family protein [Candidatus Omnitrophota bacterium]MCM8807665.1 metallophosphatase family protein [Candidatus Omnitrophota bacterium]